MSHTNEQLAPSREMTCCCCGSTTTGRQWWNRDTGFGICVPCANNAQERWPEDQERNYGVRGIHYDLMREPVG